MSKEAAIAIGGLLGIGGLVAFLIYKSKGGKYSVGDILYYGEPGNDVTYTVMDKKNGQYLFAEGVYPNVFTPYEGWFSFELVDSAGFTLIGHVVI